MSLITKYDYDMGVKLNNFEKFVTRQSMARFLARYELFKKIVNVKGSIVECGVHHGGGLMAWAKLSSALEPYAIHRKIIGFDTFGGFEELDTADTASTQHDELKKGGFQSHDDILNELKDAIDEYDGNRFLNHMGKVILVKGDATQTIPRYVEENRHLIVSLLFLDFDVYKPTKVALEHLVKRVPKGGIIAFDEINNEYWQGETVAMMEEFVSLNNYRIEKFPFDPNIAYIVV